MLKINEKDRMDCIDTFDNLKTLTTPKILDQQTFLIKYQFKPKQVQIQLNSLNAS